MGAGVLAVIAIGAAIAVSTDLLDDVESGRAVGSADGGVSGDREAWTAAVCAPDTDLATSANFLYTDAENIAYCGTRTTGSSRPQSIVIGEWPRGADLEKDLARLPSVTWFATATTGDRMTVFVLQDSPDRALLEPLTPFGFTIESLG